MQQAEEDLLVIAAQNGNQKAFQLLYQRYQQSLLRFAFKLCNDPEIAKDATHEAWLKTAKSIRKITDPRCFRSWIYQMVRWRCLDMVRQVNKREQTHDIFNEQAHSSAVNQAVDQCDALTVAINRMPPLEKQMIHLFYLDQLRIEEIAHILSIPRGTVKSRLNRARAILRQKFEL